MEGQQGDIEIDTTNRLLLALCCCTFVNRIVVLNLLYFHYVLGSYCIILFHSNWFVSYIFSNLSSVRDSYKYIKNGAIDSNSAAAPSDYPAAGDAEQVYNLTNDEDEQTNLIYDAATAERVALLKL